MATMTRDDIYKKVQTVLVDALGVDEDEVTPQAVIRDDLGAESIDFLDIIFVKDGLVTPNGIETLKQKMPHSDFSEFEKDPKVDNLSKLFTVDAIVNYVEGKVGNA
jgi:hypothetical protein